ncbi:pyridoxal phosphate-dependent transferase [Colletotrichum phormii]|uniref:Pyridoxal phosphate-dependent transferase n=1 Tax=Colletotrichum phormii TaxID=359342 RepID=A0AAI9ZLA4_9PEZI|nr:pyridoxal phosphate-dependent transferase [Colletotrichum phormii]KAK1625359.1 pyridoxal phosphate-dependent transferase [Colletotrichum phormii]
MSLSIRAESAEKAGDDLHIWKAVGNLYHPIANPTGFATLGVSENTLMARELSEHMQKLFKLPVHSFTYGDGMTGSKRIKVALAAFLNQHLRPSKPLKPAHFRITNGCSSAVEHLAWAVANTSAAFLLGQPYYNTFVPDLVLRTGCKVIPVDFGTTDPMAPEAISHYQRALEMAAAAGQRVAGLVISNPHNPIGRCYSRASLLSLMSFCGKNDMHFISDKIYALSVWENKVDQGFKQVPFESCLSLSSNGLLAPDRIHTIWGMSKDFGANGLRIGTVISQSNPSLHKALVAVALYSSPSSASDHIAANMLEDEKWSDSFIRTNRIRLADRYDLVVRWANSHGVPYAAGTRAAFFLWADLGSVWKRHNPRTVKDEELDDFMMKLFLEYRVYVSSGKDFGSESVGWFRIVFSQYEVQLLTGLERVAAALKSGVTVEL